MCETSNIEGRLYICILFSPLYGFVIERDFNLGCYSGKNDLSLVESQVVYVSNANNEFIPLLLLFGKALKLKQMFALSVKIFFLFSHLYVAMQALSPFILFSLLSLLFVSVPCCLSVSFLYGFCISLSPSVCVPFFVYAFFIPLSFDCAFSLFLSYVYDFSLFLWSLFVPFLSFSGLCLCLSPSLFMLISGLCLLSCSNCVFLFFSTMVQLSVCSFCFSFQMFGKLFLSQQIS